VYVDVGTARIYFDTVGSQLALAAESVSERPTLIVLHGGPGFDHTTLRPYFDRFADTHQVLYLDHRGNGRSTGEPESWNLAQWGDDVRAVCDALGIEKPCVYGNSFGGMVALSYASRHPDHPAKVVFSSTAARMHLQETFDMMEELGGGRARAVAERFWTEPDETSRAEYLDVCLPLYNPVPHPEEAAALKKRALMRTEVLEHFVLGEMRTMDLRAGLSAVRAPALVLAGRRDPITPVACSEEIVAKLPDGVGELRLFEHCGHGVHRDDPEEAEVALRRFLAS
jgi:pimeloyl-ACP methyl ester carboxylesterase